MDPPIVYPSVSASAPELLLSPDPRSRLQYPDPISIDAIADDVSRAPLLSPVEASETVLVTLTDAIAHLIDRDNSLLLATGTFTLVRLNQGGNGIAVFARVGKDLQWPLTKDQSSVKLDRLHYFFSIYVPPEIEAACRISSSEEKTEQSGVGTVFDKDSKGIPPSEEVLHYGITFSPNSDTAALRLLDDLLLQYSHFTAPQFTSGSGEITVESFGDEGGRDEKDQGSGQKLTLGFGGFTSEDGSAEYWTLLAPNVEDYSSGIARAIASGAGHVIRGIFWCSDATVSQLEKGSLYMKGKINARDTPTQISPAAMERMKRARKISAMCEQVATGVLSGILKAAAFVTRPLVTSKFGQKLCNLLPGQIALASLDGFGKIFDALEIAGKNVLTTTSVATTGLVSQRYGNEAGQLTQEGLNTAGGFLTTAWSVAKLRKVLQPSTFMKVAGKVANQEKKARENGNKDSKDPSTQNLK